jgi:hypothetical protein
MKYRPSTRVQLVAFIAISYAVTAALIAAFVLVIQVAHAAYVESTVCIDPCLEQAPKDHIDVLLDRIEEARNYVALHTQRGQQAVRAAGIQTFIPFDRNAPVMQQLIQALTILAPLAEMAGPNG